MHRLQNVLGGEGLTVERLRGAVALTALLSKASVREQLDYMVWRASIFTPYA
jgi:hypothetical protein